MNKPWHMFLREVMIQTVLGQGHPAHPELYFRMGAGRQSLQKQDVPPENDQAGGKMKIFGAINQQAF